MGNIIMLAVMFLVVLFINLMKGVEHFEVLWVSSAAQNHFGLQNLQLWSRAGLRSERDPPTGLRA